MKKTLLLIFAVLVTLSTASGCQTSSCSTQKDRATEEISCNKKPSSCDINKQCAL